MAVYLSRQNGGEFCARRAGRLPSGGTAFFAKESGGKESAEGALPPLHSPQCATGLKFRCGGIAPVQCHLGGSFPPMREALYCHARQVTAKTVSDCPIMGRPPKKAALLEGSGEGNEKFPSPPFLFPPSFREKKGGAVRAGRLCGEHIPPPCSGRIHSPDTIHSRRIHHSPA